jgi:hypothetical protein
VLPKTKRSNAGIGCLAVIAIFILIAIIGGSHKDHETDTSSSPCKGNWQQCSDNADMANNYSNWDHAQFACKEEAIKEARFGTPKWPWLAFGSFLKGSDYPTSGVAVLIEPDAQFQNGFGAMVHSRVVCKYDLRSEKVLSVIVMER